MYQDAVAVDPRPGPARGRDRIWVHHISGCGPVRRLRPATRSTAPRRNLRRTAGSTTAATPTSSSPRSATASCCPTSLRSSTAHASPAASAPPTKASSARTSAAATASPSSASVRAGHDRRLRQRARPGQRHRAAPPARAHGPRRGGRQPHRRRGQPDPDPPVDHDHRLLDDEPRTHARASRTPAAWNLHPEVIVTHTFGIDQADVAHKLAAAGHAGKVTTCTVAAGAVRRAGRLLPVRSRVVSAVPSSTSPSSTLPTARACAPTVRPPSYWSSSATIDVDHQVVVVASESVVQQPQDS